LFKISRTWLADGCPGPVRGWKTGIALFGAEFLQDRGYGRVLPEPSGAFEGINHSIRVFSTLFLKFFNPFLFAADFQRLQARKKTESERYFHSNPDRGLDSPARAAEFR